MEKIRFTLLIPLKYNDGTDVPQVVMDDICDGIMEIADGYTFAGTVTGAFRMKDGSKQIDQSNEYWIGVDPSREVALRYLVGVIAHRLQQEALYFERSSSVIEFVTPIEEENS